MGNGNFGVSQLRIPLNRLSKDLTHVILSVTRPRTPNFVKFGQAGACRQYGEMYTSRTFCTMTWEPLQKKKSKQFQAFNGLKCSTVGNFGSLLAFHCYNRIRVYPRFSGQSQKCSKISAEERLTVLIPTVNVLNTNRSAIKVVRQIGK